MGPDASREPVRLIAHGELRQSIADSLRQDLDGTALVSPATVLDIDAVLEAVGDNRIKGGSHAATTFEPTLSYCWLGAAATSVWARLWGEELPLPSSGTAELSLPPAWSGPGRVPNADVAAQSLLVGLANHASAVIRLVEDGLQASARSVLRAFIETSWVTLAVVDDHALMHAYLATPYDDPEKTRRWWHQHFRPKKLRARLAAIDARVGFAPPVCAEFDRLRDVVYHELSGPSHGTFGGSIVGGFRTPPGRPDDLEVAHLGGADENGIATLTGLADGLFLFHSAFLRLAVQRPDWQHLFPAPMFRFAVSVSLTVQRTKPYRRATT